MNKKCNGCFVSFTPTSNHNIYCYSCCHFICEICKKVIWRRVASTVDVKRNFCSKNCAAKGREGYDSLTPEQRKRVADAHRGIPKSEECREIMKSKALGEKNSQYKNGKYAGKGRANYEYRKWLKEVSALCGDVCKMCGARDTIFEIDHIKPYRFFPKLKYEVSNGQVLCKRCHREKTILEHKHFWVNKSGKSTAVRKLGF